MREPLSKKVRFEIFKRDSFKCQYCGACAPDVLLEVDHIVPVAAGGENDMTNLVTACASCNRGKGKRQLDDNTTLKRQHKQLEELNERRLQLELMLEWKKGLDRLKDEEVDKGAMFWAELNEPCFLNESGKRDLKKLIKRFGLAEVLDGMSIAVDAYVKTDADGDADLKTVNYAFSKIPAICAVKRREKKEPYIRDLYFIRGILRRRVYVNENYVMSLLRAAVKAKADIEWLRELAATCSSWTRFREEVEDFVDEQGGE